MPIVLGSLNITPEATTLVVKAALLALTYFIIKSNSLHVATQPRELSVLSGIGIPSAKEPPVLQNRIQRH